MKIAASLRARFLVPASILLSTVVGLVGTGATASAAGIPSAYEKSTSSNSQDVFYGGSWKAQTFTVQTTHSVTLVKLPLLRMGSPAGNVVVSIKNVDANGYPTGPDLASGSIPCSTLIPAWSPMTWYDIGLGNGTVVEAGKTYAIVWRAPDANSSNRPYYWVNAGNVYAGGRALSSWSGGSNWLDPAPQGGWDTTFQEWGEGATAAPSGPPRPYETYTGGNSQDIFYGGNWKAQTFKVQTTHSVTLVKLPLLRMGSPAGNVVVSIKNVDANGYPTGPDLASGSIPCSTLIPAWSPMTWYDISLGNGALVEAGKTYAIVWRAPDANSSNRPYYWVNAGNVYTGGRTITSSSGGSTWLDIAPPSLWDAAFQEWGEGATAGPPTQATPPPPTPVTTPPIGSGNLLKYVTAYGVSSWSGSELDALDHFDMAAIDSPDNAASPAPIRQRYSHEQLKLLGYLDIAVQVQGEGYVNFDPSSPNYWGVFIANSYNKWQSSTGNAFDGIFLDNTYAGAFDTPATQNDLYIVMDWLTGKSPYGGRRIPIVLANGGDPNLAKRADIWMSEDFATKRQIDFVASVTSQGGTAVTLLRSVPNTEAACRFNLAAFLVAVKGTAYYSFSDVWGNGRPVGSALGWYPMMDVDYGSPLGAYVQNGNILTREFTKSTVRVDLNAMTGQITMK